MPMRNLDIVQADREALQQKLQQAMQDNNQEGVAGALMEYFDKIQQSVLDEARRTQMSADASILAARGQRALTNDETKYYQALIGAMGAPDPRQALSNLDVVMPKTVIDAVFDDLVQEHPLLGAIDFTNTSGLIEYLVNTNEKQLATWDTLCAEIVRELTSGFKKISMSLDKLSAFIPICKAMLDLGPTWLDRYVRDILFESIAYGLEAGMISGTGVKMPIGMNRNLAGPVDPTTGYPAKTPVVVTDLSPATYGNLLSQIAITPNGNVRKINNVLLVVNPIDYLQKIMPATTVRGTDGLYRNNVLPFPTTIVESTEVPAGQAILGLAKRYFMGIGTAKSGTIESSDEYRFLEDERVYLIKLYGHGEPLDNNAFMVLDISGMQPANIAVKVVDSTNP